MTIEASFSTDGIAVREDFLPRARVRSLIECAQLRRERGDFVAARIGADQTLQRRADIRGDSTCWITPPLLAPELALLDELDELRLELNREAFLGLLDLEIHFAWYPPGSGYERHVDQPQGRQQRQVSLVLYLNEGWEPQWGGELRLFDADDGYRDIAPLGGRLVYFLTAGRQHAVLPTLRERLSVTGWFRTRD